jgi:hypothetical protein
MKTRDIADAATIARAERGGRADLVYDVCRPRCGKAHASIPLGAGRAVSASGKRPRRYGFGSS